jgi:hypothetical protein
VLARVVTEAAVEPEVARCCMMIILNTLERLLLDIRQ